MELIPLGNESRIKTKKLKFQKDHWRIEKLGKADKSNDHYSHVLVSDFKRRNGDGE